MGARPLLLVDVDGVISLFGFEPDAAPAGDWTSVDGHAHLLSATAGEHLRRLSESFELVWCTGWEEKANEHLPHALGLAGPIPHLCFTQPAEACRTHWKLDAIVEHAGDHRPLAWIDDTFNEACHAWAAARPGLTLLVPTEPHVGLTAEDVAMLERWAQAQRERATVVQRPSP